MSLAVELIPAGGGGGSAPALLACKRLAANVSSPPGTAFVTLLSVAIVSTLPHLAVWASLGVDVLPFILGDARFRLRVDGVTIAGVEIQALFPVVDHSVALNGCADVAAGAHTVELQWATDGGTSIFCEPVADPDHEHATLTVGQVP